MKKLEKAKYGIEVIDENDITICVFKCESKPTSEMFEQAKKRYKEMEAEYGKPIPDNLRYEEASDKLIETVNKNVERLNNENNDKSRN